MLYFVILTLFLSGYECDFQAICMRQRFAYGVSV